MSLVVTLLCQGAARAVARGAAALVTSKVAAC